MKYYLTSDVDIVSGSSATEIIEKLRDYSMFCRRQTLKEYMRGYAERTKEVFGVQITTASPEAFIKDLTANDILIPKTETEVNNYNREGMR
jgi:hypothetical protein